MLILKYEEKNGYRRTRDNLEHNAPGAYDWVTWYEDFEFEFTDKESYLAWRKQWKEDYAKISSDIRETKKDLKNEAREQAANSNADTKEVYYGLWKEESRLAGLREEARKYMAAITEAKKEAARQMEEERKAA